MDLVFECWRVKFEWKGFDLKSFWTNTSLSIKNKSECSRPLGKNFNCALLLSVVQLIRWSTDYVECHMRSTERSTAKPIPLCLGFCRSVNRTHASAIFSLTSRSIGRLTDLLLLLLLCTSVDLPDEFCTSVDRPVD